MQKNSEQRIEIIRKATDMDCGDLSKEIITDFIRKDDDPEDMPVIVLNVGVTPPTKGYYFFRENRPTYTLEYVVSGVGHIKNEEREYTVTAGDVYFLKPFSKHAYYSDEKMPYSKIWINFRSDSVESILKALKINDLTVFHCPQALELFRKLTELEKISPFRADVTYKAAEIIFSIFARLAGSGADHATEIPSDVLRIKVLLDCSMAKNISINDICEKLFMSRTQVISDFKKYYGKTPHRYVLDLKMSAACALLKNTDTKITEIASRLNFYSNHHFSAAFTKRFGVSPINYRAQAKGITKTSKQRSES